jgi:two-component system, sensor histidine kinase
LKDTEFPIQNKLPWWTWVVPFPLLHAAIQIALLFKLAQGVSTFYIPTAIGIVLINWWGPARVLPAMFIMATLNTYYWGISEWWMWPVLASPEVVGTLLSYLLFRKLAKGKYWLPSTRHFLLFSTLGLIIPITLDLLLLQTIFTVTGRYDSSLFLDNFLRNWLGEITANIGLCLPLLFAFTPILQRNKLLLHPPPQLLRKYELKKPGEYVEIISVYAILFIFSLLVPFDKYWFGYGILSLYIAIRYGFRDAIFINLFVFMITYVLPAFYDDVPNKIFQDSGQLYSIFLGNILLSFFVALTGRVITDLRIIEKRLSERNKELETTTRELDRFVYSASHDLSAPLKSILGLVTISKMDPASSQLYLAEIEKSVHKLDSFIGEILDYAQNKRSEIVPEQIRLKELCEEILANLKYMENYQNVTINLEGLEQKVITQDKVRLKIILSNLLSNAIKFQKRKSDQPPVVTVTVHNRQEKTHIQIEDNGEGIRPEFTDKVFNMFYRASETTRGSGLGLYIAKESAVKIGGDILMETKYGKGSVFTVEIPEIE